MSHKKGAFTLIEILISITLLSLVLMALYKSSDLLRESNKHLYHHLEDISSSIQGSNTLYLDLLQSDGNITIVHKEKKFDRLTVEKTKHSLYGLEQVKVTWLVYKEKHTLLRVEGTKYHLPLRERENVEIDKISEDVEFFKIHRGKKPENILVVFKLSGGQPQSFMVQNLTPLPPEPKMVNPSTFGNRQTPKKDKKK